MSRTPEPEINSRAALLAYYKWLEALSPWEQKQSLTQNAADIRKFMEPEGDFFAEWCSIHDDFAVPRALTPEEVGQVEVAFATSLSDRLAFADDPVTFAEDPSWWIRRYLRNNGYTLSGEVGRI